MKPCLFPFIIFIFLLSSAISQDSLNLYKEGTRPFYKAKLHSISGQTHSGYLMAIKDSAAFISEESREAKKSHLQPDPFHKNRFTGDSTMDRAHYLVNRYGYKMIETIKIMNQKAKSHSIILGAVMGGVIGAIIGISDGTDHGLFALTAGEKGLIAGILGGGVGALTGLAISPALEKKYFINGEWKNLEEMKASLK
jgi:hypothetical protein